MIFDINQQLNKAFATPTPTAPFTIAIDYVYDERP